MSQLIQMRQRIKAIETTKKITHAMRLISMSTHSRLRGKQDNIRTYQQRIAALFATIKEQLPEWHSPILSPSTGDEHLIIIVGSQKGLCGTFNNMLFRFIEHQDLNLQTSALITVGKHATDFITSKDKEPLHSFDHLTSGTLTTIARSIAEHITTQKQPYRQVTVVSNHSKSFFVQKPDTTQLIPFVATAIQQDEVIGDTFNWEQSPSDLLQRLTPFVLSVQLQALLFESLLAEQAARFVSMDNSTRNAQTLLEAMKINYNKLRQATITRELTDLSGSFQQES